MSGDRFVFRPHIGMITDNSYLHGIGDNSDIHHTGVIEHVGIDYFILRVDGSPWPRMICDNQYWVIERTDFHD